MSFNSFKAKIGRLFTLNIMILIILTLVYFEAKRTKNRFLKELLKTTFEVNNRSIFALKKRYELDELWILIIGFRDR